LLSDLILYDDKLNNTANLNIDILNKCFEDINIGNDLVEEIIEKNKVSVNLDGFNYFKGMPKNSVSAIVKGSVYKIKLKRTLTEEEIKKIEFTGIGFRKNEGFGQVAVNWNIHQKSNFNFEPFIKNDNNNTLKWFNIDLPDVWHKAVFTKKIEQHIIEKFNQIYKTNENDFIARNKPSNTQIQGLRNIALFADKVEKINEFLESKKDKNGEWNVKVDNNNENLIDFFKNEICDINRFFIHIDLIELKNSDKQKYHLISVKKYISLLVQKIVKTRQKKEDK
jgi:hypothetical protein